MIAASQMTNILLKGTSEFCENIVCMKSLTPGNTIWHHNTRSTLFQVMAWCLMAPSHHLIKCWQTINEVLWHERVESCKGNYRDISHEKKFGKLHHLTHCGSVICHMVTKKQVNIGLSMACFLMAPSHYLNQCWLIISEIQWHFIWGYFHKRCLNHQSLKLAWNLSKIPFKTFHCEWINCSHSLQGPMILSHNQLVLINTMTNHKRGPKEHDLKCQIFFPF